MVWKAFTNTFRLSLLQSPCEFTVLSIYLRSCFYSCPHDLETSKPRQIHDAQIITVSFCDIALSSNRFFGIVIFTNCPIHGLAILINCRIPVHCT